MAEVPTREEFVALQHEVITLKNLICQMMAAKVAVEWVRIETAETLLECSRTTIWRLIKKNELAVESSGRKVRIGLRSIRTYLEKKRYQPEVIEARINSLLAA